MSRKKGTPSATTANVRGTHDAIIPLVPGSDQKKAHDWLMEQGNSVTEKKIAIGAGMHFDDVSATMASLREVSLAEYLDKTKPVKWKVFPLDAPRKTRQAPMKEPANKMVKAVAAAEKAILIKHGIDPETGAEEPEPNILVNAAQGLTNLIRDTLEGIPDFTVLEEIVTALEIEVKNLTEENRQLKNMLQDKWTKE